MISLDIYPKLPIWDRELINPALYQVEFPEYQAEPMVILF